MRCLPILLAVTLAQVATPPTEPASARTLTIRYSDGRTTPRIVTAKTGRMWTPTFPRRGDTDRGGLGLAALQVEHTADKDTVVVAVSLIYGRPHQRTVPVASVRVKGEEPVEVGQLAAFGVDPITLSLSDWIPAALVQPAVTSASSWLDVKVDVVGIDVPIYRISMRNRSPRAVSAVSYQLFRGGKQVASGRRKAPRSLPAIEPDGTHEFTTEAASSTGSHGFDRLDVTAVLWEDGSIEGDASLKTSEQALAVGYARQLRRLLALLRDRPAASITDLRAALDALPVERERGGRLPTSADGKALSEYSVAIGEQQVKDSVRDDLSAFARAQAAGPEGPANAWIQDAIARYSAWLARTGQ